MATASVELVRRTATAAFWHNYENFPDIMDGLSMMINSDSDQEIYPWLLYAPGVKEMEGERSARTVPAIDWTIKNKKWENTIAIDYELRRFGKIGAIASIVGSLGAKARAYPSELMSDLINTGNATACYDTQFFYDTDHTDPGADYTTSQDNDLTQAAATGTDPTDVEARDGISAAVDALHSFKDGDGDPVVPAPGTVFDVHVPGDRLSQMRRLEMSDNLDTGSGTVGNDLKGRIRVIHNPWIDLFATTPACYVFNPSGARKAFIYQVADPIGLEDDSGTVRDFDSKEIRFGSFGYYNVGYGDWRYSCRIEWT